MEGSGPLAEQYQGAEAADHVEAVEDEEAVLGDLEATVEDDRGQLVGGHDPLLVQDLADLGGPGGELAGRRGERCTTTPTSGGHGEGVSPGQCADRMRLLSEQQAHMCAPPQGGPHGGGQPVGRGPWRGPRRDRRNVGWRRRQAPVPTLARLVWTRCDQPGA